MQFTPALKNGAPLHQAHRLANLPAVPNTGHLPGGMQWSLRFPAPAEWLSANKRYKRRPDQEIRAWRQATTVHARAAKLPRGLACVSVYATVHFTDKRHRDAHNYILNVKSCIDGLVDYGLIADDRREHLRWTAIAEGDPVAGKPFGPSGEIEIMIVEEVGDGLAMRGAQS